MVKKKKVIKRKTRKKNPTNNRLVQGVSNSAWPMWAPNNMSQNKRVFTGSAGTAYGS